MSPRIVSRELILRTIYCAWLTLFRKEGSFSKDVNQIIVKTIPLYTGVPIFRNLKSYKNRIGIQYFQVWLEYTYLLDPLFQLCETALRLWVCNKSSYFQCIDLFLNEAGISQQWNIQRKSGWECLPTLPGYDAKITSPTMLSVGDAHLLQAAVIWRRFTAILRINAATAANWTASAHCTTHTHTRDTLLSSIHVYWENVHDTAKVTQPVSEKRNIWTNFMYKDFLPAIAFLHLQCWINYYWWETDAG